MRLRPPLLLLLVLWAGAVSAAQPPSVHELRTDAPLAVADALAAPESAWAPVQPQRHAYGIGARPVWLRIVLPAAGVDRYVTIDNPLLEQVQFHLFDAADYPNGAPLHSVATGSALPFASRPLHGDPEFTLRVQASDHARVLLVGARTPGALRVQAFVRTSHEYAEHHWGATLLRGMYYGALLVMALYNIALAVSLREHVYGLYVGYVVMILSLVMALDGTLYQVFGGVTASLGHGWLPGAMMCTTFLAIGFLDFFVRDFLRLRPGSGFYRTLTGFGVFSFVAALLPFFYMGVPSFVLLLVFGLVSVSLYVVVGLLHWRGGDFDARLYAIGLAFILVSTALYAAMQMGVVANTLVTHHAVQLGTTIDIVLLSFALAARLKLERRASERAQADAASLSMRLEAIQRERELATKEQALQESLWRSRQLQVLGQMAGGFAHGFNNILTSMMGFAELASERANEAHDDVQRRHLTEILNGGRRAAQLVDQLLIYSGGNRRLPSNVDLVEVVDRAVSLLRAVLPAAIRLRWDAPSRPAVTRLDPDRMQQAIVNLCLNARDAIDERGEIVIELTPRSVGDAVCTSCATHFEGQHYALTVRDDGRGINGDISQIFVPFYTTRPADASGLGLSIVHAVTHECGGHLVARNLPEGGSEFALYLPT